MGMQIQLVTFDIDGIKIDVGCLCVHNIMFKNIITINLDIAKAIAVTDFGQIDSC
jgi:hypothetical protein